MEVLLNIIQYVINLGSQVFVPLIMMTIALIFGLRFGKALKAGITVGIGLIGVQIVSTLTADVLSPVINSMVERLGLNLTSIDVGGGPAAAVGFGSSVGAVLIVVVVAVNIILVATKLTNTINVDVYNFWYFAITAGFVQILTGNFFLAILAGLTHAILGLKIGDIMAKRTQDVIGIGGITIPHGFAAASAPLFMILDKIYDYIPILKDKKGSEDNDASRNSNGISKMIGAVLGDKIYLGLILGLFFGIVAGYGVSDILNVTVSTAAIMVLFPTMVKMIVEGLIPISNQAKKFFAEKFKDRELYIGLDSAVTIGHSVTISVGMLMIPVFMFVAAILPGNTTLPLGEVPFAAFYVCFATIVHKGNRIRTIISSLIFIPIVLWLSSWAAPLFTQLGENAGLTFVQEGQTATTMALGNFFIWLPVKLAEVPILGAVFLLAVIALALIGGKYLEKRYSKSNGI
ncbi:PTS galactitol transporter subunit IIC [Oceanobacillus jeddahense]|uniref:PTS galactitol transporter subunit IIC n=1 Tax=Oceanobacillus jeddahense TaxID=1462527 RepID=UPI0005958E29|nr:PTS transporter subunit IIC [Oceanobacillus jeddahense]